MIRARDIIQEIEYLEERIREYDDSIDKEELKCLKEELQLLDAPGQLVFWEAR